MRSASKPRGGTVGGSFGVSPKRSRSSHVAYGSGATRRKAWLLDTQYASSNDGATRCTANAVSSAAGAPRSMAKNGPTTTGAAPASSDSCSSALMKRRSAT